MRIALTLTCACLPMMALAQSTALAPADEAAAFTAAGFKRTDGAWRACEDPGTSSYQAGVIEQVADLNGDGRPEAIIAEHSGFCYGMQGSGYMLVSQQADGGWRLVTSGSGMLTPLKTRGAGGWQDLEIGGPGFCFAVERWNGTEYQLHRWEYEGKACKPSE
jgi:hypothetical protein